jgi:cytidylate kinase
LEESRQGRGSDEHPHRFTIALSRQAGVHATAVARELARQLGWTAYDQELLQKIADEMGLRRHLLEGVDEKHGNWLRESLQQFVSVPAVSETSYVRRLIETILSLGAHGHCIIVGRGAAHLLPAKTTLRVRLVAPLDYRIAAFSKEQQIDAAEAARRIDKIESDRNQFIKDYFHIDHADPANYDVVLNMARLGVGGCVAVIADALARLQRFAEVPA